jgi:uncharacterized membrane protein
MMTPRMLLALASLVNALVAGYLHLWKIGKAGVLTCGATHGCEVVQFSSYGSVPVPWGGVADRVDVALIGFVGWLLIAGVAVYGTAPHAEDRPGVTRLLTGLVGFALLFTLRLKYGEFVVLRSFCPWCAVNAGVVILSVVLVWRDWVRLRDAGVLGRGPAAYGLTPGRAESTTA